ncbi:MAG: hypothetical protein ACRDD1_16315 [Planctomycetia bacterium]
MSRLAAYLEGESRRRRDVILQLGTRRFGPTDRDLEEELESIHDLERLDRMVEAVISAGSWLELLAPP